MEKLSPRARRHRSPSLEKTAKTQRAILAAATDVFLEKGYAQARIDEIASRASVAKGNIYEYFTDKKSLFDSVVNSISQDQYGTVVQLQPSDGESVRSFLLNKVPPLLINFANSKRGAILRIILTEGYAMPDISKQYHSVVLEPLWDGFRQLAKLALDNGELESDSLVRFPELLTAPALMSVTEADIFQNRDRLRSEELFIAIVEAFFSK